MVEDKANTEKSVKFGCFKTDYAVRNCETKVKWSAQWWIWFYMRTKMGLNRKMLIKKGAAT